MIQRPDFLQYRNYRYLKAALLLGLAAIGVHWAGTPPGGAYGGTWSGYVLGIAAAGIVLILFGYGLRKRRAPLRKSRRAADRRTHLHAPFNGVERRREKRRQAAAVRRGPSGDTLQGWLSAHVYLGLLLILIASLHSGLRLELNIHTLTYLLLVAVVVSGILGAFAYLRYPRLLASTGGSGLPADIATRLDELDTQARTHALGLPDEVGQLVRDAEQATRIGGNLWQQLRGTSRACPTAAAVKRVRQLGEILIEGEQPQRLRDLYAVLLRKQRLLDQARRVTTFKARMQVWVYLHAPLSVALLAGLASHVLLILVYW